MTDQLPTTRQFSHTVKRHLHRQLRVILDLLGQHKKILFVIILLMTGESAFALASPWLAGQFTRALLNQQAIIDVSYRQVLVVWLVVLAVHALLRFGNTFLTSNLTESILSKMRVRIYDHLQAMPLSYYFTRKRGEVLTAFTNDADIVSEFFVSSIVSLLPQVLTVLGALYFITVIDPLFTLILGFSVPLFYLSLKVLGKNIRPVTQAMLDSYAKAISIIAENLQLLPIIKSFSREANESTRFSKENSSLLLLTSRYLWWQSMLSPIAYFIASSATLLLLWLGATRVESGLLSIDQLVSLLLYGMLLTRPVASLADVYGDMQHARSATERLSEIFDHAIEQVHRGQAFSSKVKGEVEFKDVSFGYDDNENILKGLSLKVEAGETVAITGENGSGKSTLAYLLQRFSDPQGGSIHVDGIDISTLSLSALRNQIGVVSQQVLLLAGSVRENILFGRADADQQSIEAAATAARATSFIENLPQGFDTLIGEQGVKLSGGQKQRLALARAILKDAPILILDEATAMFDPQGEKEFISECHQLLRLRTVLLITHRPASLALADRILVIEDGKIIEPNRKTRPQL